MLRTICFVFLALAPVLVQAQEPDWSLYDRMLKTYVKPGHIDGVATNLVDYAGLADDPMFPQLVGDVRAFDPMLLSGDKERLAFYINAYNILALQVALDHWPIKSMKDIGGSLQNAWTAFVINNFDGKMSLDDIEQKELMSTGDPRVHFAIHCNAVSGPDLRREPYRAATLDRQLDDQVRRFLSSRKALVVGDHKVNVSHLFSRYEDDFSQQGGIAKFIHKYRPQVDTALLEADLPYDWKLNNLKSGSDQ